MSVNPGRLATILLVCVFYSTVAAAEVSADKQEFRSLDEQVQSLKGEVININRELMLLQEKLVYPSNTEVSVFVSLQASNKFSLDSIDLQIDNKSVQKHVYTYRELEAMLNKGVQRLYTGNLANGKHQVTVKISGHTASNSGYEKSAAFTVSKENGPKLVELQIVSGGGAPSIKLTNWK